MKKSKKVTALLTVLLICLTLIAACGGTSGGNSGGNTTPAEPVERPVTAPIEVPAPPEPIENVRYADEINLITDGLNVTTLNPLAQGGPAPFVMSSYNLMYDRLVYPLGNGEYAPYLASEWETEDYKTFIFKLREDVYFHNGEKFTANDVIFTINSAKANLASQASGVWGFVEEATAINDYTLQVVLDAVNVEFLYYVGRPDAGICNEKAVTEDPEKGAWIGTGAYRLTEFVASNYWVFERNDEYWGDPPVTRKVTMRHIPEASARTIMMQNGESQICFGIPTVDQELFENNPDYVFLHHMINNPNPLLFNMSDPLCSDYNFRMAIGSALNRAEIAAVLSKYTIPASDGGVYGYEQEFRNTEIPMVPEDLEAAKRYLEASPYQGEEVEITVTPTFIRTVEVLQQQFLRAGINTRINQVEGTAVNSLTTWGNNKSQLMFLGLQLYTNGSTLRNILYPRTTSNRMSYDNPEVTELFDRAAAELDYETRKEMYMEIQRLVAADPPWFNINFSQKIIVGAKGIGGFGLPADTFYDLRYMYLQLDD